MRKNLWLCCLALGAVFSAFARPEPFAGLKNPDSLNFESIHQELLEGQYGFIDHLLIYKDNQLIFDESYRHNYDSVAQHYDQKDHPYNYYHPNWHPFYQGTALHTLQSSTKSITSLLVGIAIDEGLISGLDMKVMPLFEAYHSKDPWQNKMTLEDLLSMRAGIKWDEWTVPYTDPANNCALMENEDHWLDYIFKQGMDTLPGTEFVYNGGATVLLGEIIRKKTGMPIDQWAEKKLFKPLGIKKYYWKKSPSGEVDTEGGLYLSVKDFAKIGLLLLNEGKWQEKQIVSKKWLDESTREQVKVDEYHSYSYQWWNLPAFDLVFAGGYGDQFIFMNRKSNLLIVTTGWNIFKLKVKPLRYSLISEIFKVMSDK